MNSIGLSKEKSENLSNQLNDLLANYQLFYMNVRGFHWNIKGNKFFELHVKFEELYNDLQVKIDEIAERVLTLGHTPMHSFADYLEASDIKTVTNATGSEETVSSVLEAFKTVIMKQRVILESSGEADDEGTQALMSDYIREQEKLVWMYTAYLS
ncbi:DNA starvation/stationary phase protection protein [bacterium SCSIO 12643]|nr:DNA starvation/stationary phase protection protein [bacterium SCSIO 12643]